MLSQTLSATLTTILGYLSQTSEQSRNCGGAGGFDETINNRSRRWYRLLLTDWMYAHLSRWCQSTVHVKEAEDVSVRGEALRFLHVFFFSPRCCASQVAPRVARVTGPLSCKQTRKSYTLARGKKMNRSITLSVQGFK